MSFQQALSGLNAASRGLEIIGNNIANANTTGAKASRAEFTDVYSASLNSGGSSNLPLGVQVGAVSQSFTQGNINLTGNNMDLAINGNGFFQVTTPDGSTAYSRAGEFKLDRNGFIVNNAGAKVMGFPTDTAGVRTNSTPIPLQLPSGGPIAANMTTTVTAQMNLDARTPTATATTPISQTSTTLMTYDSQGVEVPLSLSFVKNATANTWDVYSSSNGAAPVLQGGLSFAADGSLIETLDASGTPTGTNTLPIPMTSTGGATAAWSATVDFNNCTQMGSAFGVSTLAQNGWAPGELNSVNVNTDGTIAARYSNGQQQTVGQVMLANFRNPQGLVQLGGGTWGESSASGQPVRGAPGEGNLGQLQSGALEESNVDLTGELVNMMTAQRTYQANAQTIKTMDQVMSTLMNLR